MSEKTLSEYDIKRICKAFNEAYDSLMTLSISFLNATAPIKRLGDALKEYFPDEFPTTPEKGG